MHALTYHGAHGACIETRMPLAHAAEACPVFDRKQEDGRKVVLRPS